MRSSGGPARLSRIAAEAGIGDALRGASAQRLRDLVRATDDAGGTGIGGRSGVVDVDGLPVFVKRVPLTDAEQLPGRTFSTANLFELPAFYHYGFGSCGFGAWRELALHQAASAWVRDGACTSFPLLHHWTVLQDEPPDGFLDQLGGLEGSVARWGGDHRIRARLEALSRSTTSLVLFLEYVPLTLAQWLRATPEADLGDVLDDLRGITRFLRERGVVHFDAHFHNVLTDGEQLYLTDFGLALSSGFELAEDEAGFLARHDRYDHHYVANHLVKYHVADPDQADSYDQLLQSWITGSPPDDAPAGVTALLGREAETMLALERLHQRLWRGDVAAPCPSPGP